MAVSLDSSCGGWSGMTVIACLQVAAGELMWDRRRAADLRLQDIVESVAAVDWRSVPPVEFIVARGLVTGFFFELATRQRFLPMASQSLARLGAASAGAFSTIAADAFRLARLRVIAGSTEVDERVQTALELIRVNCERRVRVDDLAVAVGLSRWHLERLTKRETGASLRQHVVSVRLARALELLEQGHLSVKELAFRVGYGNANAFSRDFRRWYGASPRGWLRSH